MLGDHGEVSIMDWGIAVPSPDGAPEILVNVAPVSVDGGVSGTPQYMSPEQAQGKTVDVRSDVYTLGAILYEITSLERPLRGDSVSELLENAKRGAVRPFSEAMPQASPSLAAVVTHALERDPSKRYASARELARDVEVVLDGRTPTAEQINIAWRFGRFYTTADRARLRPMDLDLLMGGGVAFGVAFGIWFSQRLEGWGWAFAVLAALFAVPPLVQWFRSGARDR